MTTDPQTDPLDKAQRRGDHWKRMAQLLEADRDRADKALAHAEQRATALDTILTRVGQMVGAWEQQLPETIATATAVDAIRTTLERADSLPPLDRRQLLDRAVAHLRSIPIQCTALTGPAWYGQGWKEAIDELEEFTDRVAAPAAVSPPPDRAALRDRIAEAIHGDLTAHRARRDQGLLGIVPRLTDAVLGVLPEQDWAAEDVIARVQQACHDLPYEYARQILNALDRTDTAAPVAQQPATEARPESCAHCGKNIQRVTGTLAAWWVHDPGGNTVCFPQQAASSPRATPKPAPVAQQPARSRTARFLDALTHSGPGYDLTTPATEEQPAAEAHACGNCSGIDPDTCLMNPDRQQLAAADTDEEPRRG